MATDIEKLLEKVAREVIAEADGVTEELYPSLFRKQFPLALEVLTRTLGPYMKKADAMRNSPAEWHDLSWQEYDAEKQKFLEGSE